MTDLWSDPLVVLLLMCLGAATAVAIALLVAALLAYAAYRAAVGAARLAVRAWRRRHPTLRTAPTDPPTLTIRTRQETQP